MKWQRPEPKRPYQISEDGKWMVNRAFVRGEPVYTLVRLGKEKRTARGEQFWEGSEPVHYGTREECEAIADSV